MSTSDAQRAFDVIIPRLGIQDALIPSIEVARLSVYRLNVYAYIRTDRLHHFAKENLPWKRKFFPCRRTQLTVTYHRFML